MDTEHLCGARLWTLAAVRLLAYGLIGFMAFRSWQARHEAKTIIALAEQYKQAHGRLPDCESDASFKECTKLGLEEAHATYEKKSETRYQVVYFGFLGMSYYDSPIGAWRTAYWWNGSFAEALR